MFQWHTEARREKGTQPSSDSNGGWRQVRNLGLQPGVAQGAPHPSRPSAELPHTLEVFLEVIRGADTSEVLTQKTVQIGRDLTLIGFLYSFPMAETLAFNTHASFLTVLEGRSRKSKCQLGPPPTRALGENLLIASSSFQWLWPPGLVAASLRSLPPPSPVLLLYVSTPSPPLTLVRLVMGNLASFPHFKIFNLITSTKTLFPNEVTL